MAYPNNIIPTTICVTLSLSRDRRDLQAACSDGNNATNVVFRILERHSRLHFAGNPGVMSVPLSVVENSNDLEAYMNVTCKREDKEFDDRGVIWVVNENYELTYIITKRFGTILFLMAREVPTAAQLELDIAQIETLKGKNGTLLCNKEIYEQFRSGH
ncbi:hypothetical protein HF086_017381 [Spodoptera exigua]|uniref:Uncharacterized protein n=1 Tax=Spodoptera exigua TaxID=7107 RepID=A0A922S7Z8_SPOEX|nr:hypothetical protein HF086_017381 [Spodoptera exigua]